MNLLSLLDIKQFLFKEMILKEDEYREKLAKHDWGQYRDEWLAVSMYLRRDHTFLGVDAGRRLRK
jgi:hypothetical protein